ncbi:MAG: acyl-CoA dehydrogenase [Comamonadaceae bacterium]|nr:MAG: acyl-CoA dehydrogenase [Comamonadaceae bacterium]
MLFKPRTDEMLYVLTQVVHAERRLQELPAHAEVDAELMAQLMDEAGKFVASVIAPLNRIGDETGARWSDGAVTMPPGFRDAYQAFWQAGWPALAAAPEDGGQGLPAVLEAMLFEMLSAANHAWTMAPDLLHGAYDCLKAHGTQELKDRYLDKLASGEWLPTMCLTEPHAGSDLGLVSTRAVAQTDGSYRISGSKIFISSGEHDLSDNIVHLVLARLPDAPPGPKGLSLFLVPKFLPDGARSAVHCERIEEKMGLHGSATCVMRFEAATGWLIGESGRGLNAMFVMMNSARLHVALQGIGLLEAAWQKADEYSRERRQMRAPGRKAAQARSNAAVASAADLIGEHPAMRRILDSQRAWIDAGRVIAYRTALELDIAKQHPSSERREAAQRWCSLSTPILKAIFTQQAFYGGSECLQVFGGHGYVRESGIEQHVRDARVTMIYEGSNEIQAIDLLLRKVLPDGAFAFNGWLAELGAELDPAVPAQARLLSRLTSLREHTQRLLQAAAQDDTLAYWLAEDFLHAVGLTLVDWAWTQIERSSEAAEPRWRAPAQAVQRWIMPELDMRLAIIDAAVAPS